MYIAACTTLGTSTLAADISHMLHYYLTGSSSLVLFVQHSLQLPLRCVSFVSVTFLCFCFIVVKISEVNLAY